MSTIPASAIVQVTPSVLSAGGRALDIQGLLLTRNTLVPLGVVQEFANATDVGNYFGQNSTEKALASIYFQGFTNSNIKPSKILFTQYPAGDVAAYLRGGEVDVLTLTQLNALAVGTLTIRIDGALITAPSVDLSTATSFSNAAAVIQAAFITTQASATSNTISGTTLTLGGTITGEWAAGQTVLGGGVTIGTYITGFLAGTPNTAGATYSLSAENTVAVGEVMTGGVVPQVSYNSVQGAFVFTTVLGGDTETIDFASTSSVTFTGTGSGTNLTVTSPSGTIGIGYTITGAGVPTDTTIESQTSGTPGGAGVYVTNNTTSSSAATITAAPTGTLAASLFLTQATGAVISQGGGLETPAAFMTGITEMTQDWATFMTCFDPDDGSGNTEKLAFATWNGTQINRWCYVCWDTDTSPSTVNPATTSLGYLLAQSEISGTCLIGGDGTNSVDASYAAFICGSADSINFSEVNGRTTFAFRSQSGLVATCTNQSKGDNLMANGYNFYGAYATANDEFIFFYPGSVSGEFLWLDSYIDQIWLNNQFQLALMVLLTNTKSIPYNQAGYNLIRAACMDPINQGLLFGAFRPGVTLSEAQAAEVNNDAGITISTTLNQRGWYLQVLDASPQVRAARGSPPCTFWYMDGQSVQHINLASIELV